MTKKKQIPYTELKRIILNCPDKRTQAALAFDYGFGARIGEIARDYRHYKKLSDGKKVLVYMSQGPTIADLKTRVNIDGQKELVFNKPNFKQKLERNSKKEVVDINRFESFINAVWEPWLFDIVINWVLNRPIDEVLFNLRQSQLRYLINKELKKYNSEYSSHWLRHSRGSDIAEITQDPYAVQAILGHGDIRTSMHYVNKLSASLYKAMQGRNGFEDVLGRSVIREVDK